MPGACLGAWDHRRAQDEERSYYVKSPMIGKLPSASPPAYWAVLQAPAGAVLYSEFTPRCSVCMCAQEGRVRTSCVRQEGVARVRKYSLYARAHRAHPRSAQLCEVGV